MDVLKEANLYGVQLYEEHKRFVSSFDERWRSDERVMLLLSAIALFSPDRPNVLHKDVVKLEQVSGWPKGIMGGIFPLNLFWSIALKEAKPQSRMKAELCHQRFWPFFKTIPNIAHNLNVSFKSRFLYYCGLGKTRVSLKAQKRGATLNWNSDIVWGLLLNSSWRAHYPGRVKVVKTLVWHFF